jgi:hypothetical protein
VTTTAPDPWADAWQAATEQVLDRRLVAVRRRIWFREAMVLVVGCALLLAATLGLTLWLTPGFGTLWSVPLPVVWVGFGLGGVGIVLVIAANVRSSTKRLGRSFVGPDAYLPPADRAWVRRQIARGEAVPAQRRYVVRALAHRMRAEGVQSLSYAGLVVLYVGMVVAVPTLMNLVVFTGLTVWMVVRVVRAVLWSGRARRWLALHP